MKETINTFSQETEIGVAKGEFKQVSESEWFFYDMSIRDIPQNFWLFMTIDKDGPYFSTVPVQCVKPYLEVEAIVRMRDIARQQLEEIGVITPDVPQEGSANTVISSNKED